MPADRLLSTVLRAYQGVPDADQNNRILGSTTSLLTTLSNPLNVTLLTTHLLSAPAIWNHTDGLHIPFRIVSVFNTAAITVYNNQAGSQGKPYDAYQPRKGGGIASDDWATAVVKGLDDRTPRWQHVLVIGGILLGMEGQDRHGLSRVLRTKLENAMVLAVNLAITETIGNRNLSAGSVVLTLNHTFPLLSNNVRQELNYDALIMPMTHAMTLAEGYQEGYLLEALDFDVREGINKKFDWSPKSASFLALQKLSRKPIIASMGPLSRLVAHGIENLTDPSKVLDVLDHIRTFTGLILDRWTHNKLSEVDRSEESSFLSPETLRVTVPFLWQVLRTAMFAVVVILRSVLGRTLIDPFLASAQNAPVIASKTLTILHNVHFISSRTGTNAFSAYTFVNITAIDIISRYPTASVAFLHTIYPPQAGRIPDHPLERNHDLFYLNTTEHFTLSLTPPEAEVLVVKPCTPYLSPSADFRLLEIFEAAHSAMLAVLAAPQNEVLTAKVVPFYVESLFSSFPQNLSPRQFRFAFKALIQICTPPNPLSRSEPMMAETFLEMLHYRAIHAPTNPLAPNVTSKSETDGQNQDVHLSEQAVLMLTLLDVLPFITLEALQNWLPLAADLLNIIQDISMKDHCKRRFWEVLETGEMDVERSAICVEWWSTRGGRDKVLFGGEPNEGDFLMSGGLGVDMTEKSRL